MNRKPVVIIVDDDKDIQVLLQKYLNELDFDLICYDDPVEMFENIDRTGCDLMLLDRYFPSTDGFSVVKSLSKNEKFQHVPIVMITGSARDRSISDGLDLGVYYYLAKPIMKHTLLSVVKKALQQHELLTDHQELLDHFNNMLSQCVSMSAIYRSSEQCYSLAFMISQYFDNSYRLFLGLYEVMMNSLEHGLFGIGFEKKNQLLECGKYELYIKEKDVEFENGKTFVSVRYLNRGNVQEIIIKDPGKGFDPKKFYHLDTERSSSLNGRGITKAVKISFDQVLYSPKGNEVKLLVYGKKKK